MSAARQKQIRQQEANKRNRALHNRASVGNVGIVADSAVGISLEGNGSFTELIPLSDNPQSILNTASDSRNIADKWRWMSESLVKQGAWSNIRRLMNRIPATVEEMFNKLEKDITNPNERLSEESRVTLYKEFYKMSSTSLGELQGWDVEILIHSDPVKKVLRVQHLEPALLSAMVKEAVNRAAAPAHSSKSPGSAAPVPEERHSAYDLERFAMVSTNPSVISCLRCIDEH